MEKGNPVLPFTAEELGGVRGHRNGHLSSSRDVKRPAGVKGTETNGLTGTYFRRRRVSEIQQRDKRRPVVDIDKAAELVAGDETELWFRAPEGFGFLPQKDLTVSGQTAKLTLKPRRSGPCRWKVGFRKA